MHVKTCNLGKTTVAVAQPCVQHADGCKWDRMSYSSSSWVFRKQGEQIGFVTSHIQGCAYVLWSIIVPCCMSLPEIAAAINRRHVWHRPLQLYNILLLPFTVITDQSFTLQNRLLHLSWWLTNYPVKCLQKCINLRVQLVLHVSWQTLKLAFLKDSGCSGATCIIIFITCSSQDTFLGRGFLSIYRPLWPTI